MKTFIKTFIFFALCLTLALYAPGNPYAADGKVDKLIVKEEVLWKEMSAPLMAPTNYHRVFIETTNQRLQSIDANSELRKYAFETTTAMIVNSAGGTVDFIARGDNQTELFWVDAGDDSVKIKAEGNPSIPFFIGDSAGSAALTVNVGASGYLLGASMIVNDNGEDYDTIIRGDNATSLFHVDAANDTVEINGEANTGNVFRILDNSALSMLAVTTGAGGASDGGAFTFNEDSRNVDIRMEGQAAANLFHLDASANSVTINSDAAASQPFFIGDAQGSAALSVNVGTSGELAGSEMVFNGDQENYDFRFMGDSEGSLLFLDASKDMIGIGTDSLAPWSAVRHALQWHGDGGAIWADGTNFNMSVNMYDAGSQDIYVMNPAQGAAMLRMTSSPGSAGSIGLRIADDALNGITWWTMISLTQAETVINESSIDSDTRIETNNESSFFKIDAGTDTLTLKSEADAGQIFSVTDAANQSLFVVNAGGSGQGNGSEAVFNDTGVVYSLRVESNNDASLFVTDATNDAVVIGAGSATVGGDAIFEITSTTKGFLPSRMTDAQMHAIATPATGLQVFNTGSNTPAYYDGVQWAGMAGGSQVLFHDRTQFSSTTAGGTEIMYEYPIPANYFAKDGDGIRMTVTGTSTTANLIDIWPTFDGVSFVGYQPTGAWDSFKIAIEVYRDAEDVQIIYADSVFQTRANQFLRFTDAADDAAEILFQIKSSALVADGDLLGHHAVFERIKK